MSAGNVLLTVSCILMLECLLLARLYYCRLVRPHRLRSNQYRFFALRDRAVHLAIDSPELKDDQLWKAVYLLINETAKQKNVMTLMQTGFPALIEAMKKAGFQLEISRQTDSDSIQSGTPIDDLRSTTALLVRFVVAVLEICWTAAWWWRIKHILSSRIGRFRRFFAKKASGGYASWQMVLSAVAKPASQSKFASEDFDDVIKREAKRQNNHAHCGTA